MLIEFQCIRMLKWINHFQLHQNWKLFDKINGFKCQERVFFSFLKRKIVASDKKIKFVHFAPSSFSNIFWIPFRHIAFLFFFYANTNMLLINLHGNQVWKKNEKTTSYKININIQGNQSQIKGILCQHLSP